MPNSCSLVNRSLERRAAFQAEMERFEDQRRLLQERAERQRQLLFDLLALQPTTPLMPVIQDYLVAGLNDALIINFEQEHRVTLSSQPDSLEPQTLEVGDGDESQSLLITPTHVEPFRVGYGADAAVHCFVYFRLELV